MGGIRKKTSKRGTTFQASKITKKARETRKKNKRSAKQDETWKSKKKKDPGIPNNFPYKNQILAEVAAAREAAQEEKERRREAQKAAAKAAKEGGIEALLQNAEGRAEDVDENEYEENPGVMPLYNRKAVNGASLSVGKGKEKVIEAEEEDIPDLVDTELPNLQAAIDRADVVVEVLDIRDPLNFRSGFLESMITEGETKESWKERLVLVLNKADLVPREIAEGWIRHLRSSFSSKGKNVEVVLFKSSFVETVPKPGVAVYGAGKEAVPRAIPSGIPVGRGGLLNLLKGWARAKAAAKEEEGLKVVFVGEPNVGKSAVINTLLGRPLLPTAPTLPSQNGKSSPGSTTTSAVEVDSNGEKDARISFIDTPGWDYAPPDLEGEEQDEDEDEEMDSDEEREVEVDEEKWNELERLVARDTLMRNLGRIDKVKDTFPLVNYIVSRASPQDLMLAYNIPHIEAGDVEAFLIAVARATGRMKKHGEADTTAAAKTILRDWSHNMFPYYTQAPKAADSAVKVDLTAEDEAALKMLKSKSDMRKVGKGLIKMKVGQVDERELVIDDDYVQLEMGDLDDSDLEDGMLNGEDELEVDEEEDDLTSGEEVDFSQDEQPSESEEEDEPVVVPVPVRGSEKKRKRHSSPGLPAPLSKKAKRVVFALDDPEESVVLKKAEVKVGTSGKLKRKGGDDEQERGGKRARRAVEVEEAEEEVAAPAERAVKPLRREVNGKAAKAAKAEPAKKPVKVAATNGSKSKPKAVPATATKQDELFDFNALFN